VPDPQVLHRFTGAGLPKKRRPPLSKPLVVFAIDGKRPLAELHLAEIDYAVVAINQEIDLCAIAIASFAAPCANSADNARRLQQILIAPIICRKTATAALYFFQS
jgi:hypothetical protein